MNGNSDRHAVQVETLIAEYRDNQEYSSRLIKAIDTLVYIVLGYELPDAPTERLSLLEDAADIRHDLMILGNRL